MRIRLSRNQIELLTPAKVNLFLEVLGRREDGFHELETIMSSVSLFDTLRFKPRADSEIVLRNKPSATQRGGSMEIPLDESNLIYHAIDKIRARLNTSNGMDVWVTKRIPVRAGLGGASSNAAGALVAANHLYKGKLGLNELRAIASELGSDVPFFLTGGMAKCTGRGEHVTSVHSKSGISMVLAKPPVGLSTAKVFGRCRPANCPTQSNGLVKELSRGKLSLFGKLIFNRLEEAASEMTEWIDRLKSTFTRLNCVSHQMSGSGSTYFGIFSNRVSALRAANCLSNQHSDASIFTCETLSCFLPAFLSFEAAEKRSTT